MIFIKKTGNGACQGPAVCRANLNLSFPRLFDFFLLPAWGHTDPLDLEHRRAVSGACCVARARTLIWQQHA